MSFSAGTILGREPAMVLGLIQAVIALGISFGLRLTPEQTGAMLAVASVMVGLIVRQQVTPSARVERLSINNAAAQPGV